MSIGGVGFGYGVLWAVDQQLRWQRTSHPVYLRIRNFPDLQQQSFSQIGFAIAPTGTSQVGTTDILIDPPASTKMVSTHNIGQSEGKLRFGARTFYISHSFVINQLAAQGIIGTDDNVWRGPQVVGLVLDSLLFSIEVIDHEEIAGQTIAWHLTANALESK